ncbi:MAG: esterase [Alphaproteobacteria bacterium]|nr:esterase [Alphaproteobacteria bacterium]MCB9927886.1 esterase [Alphaproteobacteria bacterium]
MSFSVRAIGGFHLGGRMVELSGLPVRRARITKSGPEIEIDPNGRFAVEQMYVQYTLLAAPSYPYPVLLWHGGGQTGVTWEDTPDGRPGWQQRFLEAGFDVYCSDAVERGRASWAKSPEVFEGEPIFRSQQDAWRMFRFGPLDGFHVEHEQRTYFADSEWPADATDQYQKQVVARWAGHDAITQKAYDELVERVGPCVIVSHSQSGAFSFQAAVNNPAKVRAVVSLEPSGPADATEARLRALAAAGTKHLVLWGDHFEGHERWAIFRGAVAAYGQRVAAAGGDWAEWDLPQMGIAGNSHFPMMDRNSDLIARMVQQWLADHVP